MEKDYAAQYRELWDRHWWWRSRRNFVMEQLANALTRDQRGNVLDVGCGDGLFFEDLQRYGEVWGIEPEQIAVSKDCQYRDRISIAHFDRQFQPARRYDLIVMLDVLEHIDDDLDALAYARELMTPNAVLLLTVPALPMLWSQHDVINQHYRRYTKSSLNRLLLEANFCVLNLQYFFGWTVLPLMLRRMMNPVVHSSEPSRYTVDVPGRVGNAAGMLLSKIDFWLARRFSLPLGTSLIAVCKQPTRG